MHELMAIVVLDYVVFEYVSAVFDSAEQYVIDMQYILVHLCIYMCTFVQGTCWSPLHQKCLDREELLLVRAISLTAMVRYSQAELPHRRLSTLLEEQQQQQ
jgi:hypothetical protein